MRRNSDIFVIGGGLAGLLAACRIARAGRTVHLVEAGRTLGGRARATALATTTANVGPHALYAAGHLAAALATLGVRVSGGRPAAGAAIWSGSESPLPAGPATLLRSRLLPGRSKWAFLRAVAALRRADARKVTSLTVAAALERLTDDRHVRTLLAALVRLATYVHAPDLMSAEIAWTQLQLALRGGVRYVDGGWQALVDGLATCARAQGVRVETGRRVARVTVERGGPRVHLPGGAWRDAAAVVVATGPRRAARLLADVLDPATLSPPASVHAACVDLVLEGPPPAPPHLVLGIDVPHYLSVHSAYANLGPPDRHLVSCAAYLPPNATADAGRAALADLETWVAALRPSWQHRIVAIRRMPHLPVVPLLPRAADGGFAGRPRHDLLAAAGIFLAGDYVGAHGHLADAAAASAKAAADDVLAILGPSARAAGGAR